MCLSVADLYPAENNEWRINLQTTGNTWMFNSLLVNIVIADALVLK